MTARMTHVTRFHFPATKTYTKQTSVITRVLAAGFIAGIVSGLFVAALQHVTTTPLILTAEIYEVGGEAAQRGLSTLTQSALLHRTINTSLSTIALSMGYALILLAVMLLSEEKIDAYRATLWAACAFAATGLSAGLELAPQLPGSAETALHDRQIWWLTNAALSASGLYLVIKIDPIPIKIVGLALIVAPHFFAPHPATPESHMPAELAARFAAASLSVQALSWLLAGALAGAIFQLLNSQNNETRR